jgi:hypothetical protein
VRQQLVRLKTSRRAIGRALFSVFASTPRQGEHSARRKKVLLYLPRRLFPRCSGCARPNQSLDLLLMPTFAIKDAATFKAQERGLQSIEFGLLLEELTPDFDGLWEVGDVASGCTPKSPTADAEVFNDGLEREIIFELHGRYGPSWMSLSTMTGTEAPRRTVSDGLMVISRSTMRGQFARLVELLRPTLECSAVFPDPAFAAARARALTFEHLRSRKGLLPPKSGNAPDPTSLCDSSHRLR